MRNRRVTTTGLLLMSVWLSSAGGQDLPTVEVRDHRGRPTAFVNGKPLALTGYCNFGPVFWPTRSKSALDFYLSVGMDVYYLQPPNLPKDFSATPFWDGDTISSSPVAGKGLWDLGRQAEYILQKRPDAYLIVSFGIRPPNSWKKLHAAEYFVSEEGRQQDTPSLASDTYWTAASAVSAAIIRHVESQPWAKRVIGYSNWHHTEGVHMPVADGWLFDHSTLMHERWQEFLRTKYGAVEKLRAAYKDPALAFGNVPVPKDKLRGGVPAVTQILYWQAGPDNQPLRDYLELTRDLFHKRFRQLGAAMSGAAQRKVLFLHDALKQTMVGWNLKGFFGYSSFGQKESWSPAFPELMAGSGSMGVASLYGAPGFDGLDTPHDYQTRGMGGIYEPEGIVDSTVLRGKLMYSQMDSRFHATYGIGAARNLREAAALTWRNWATSLTRGFWSYLCWGFEMENWHYVPEFRSVMRRQVAVMREALDWAHATMPGIAVILDDSSVLETNGSGNFLNEAFLWEWHTSLPRCGIPFRVYLFEDLELENFPKHRVYYFPNLFRVDDRRMAILRRKVFGNGHVVVWGPGSGISDGTRISKDSAEKLTGFKFRMLPANSPRRVLVSRFDHPITQGLDAATIFGGPLAYGPVLLPTSGTALGVSWSKGGMNDVGMSVLSFGKGAAGAPDGIAGRGPGDYDAVFLTAVQLPAALWRNLGRYAGAHVYNDAGDIVMADSSVVALHSLKPGRKTIRLPGTYAVRDLITGQPVAKQSDTIVFDLSRPDTRVFLLK